MLEITRLFGTIQFPTNAGYL